MKYFLLDANTLVSYYCKDEPEEIRKRVGKLFARHAGGEAFLYVPNFCVVEVLRSIAKKCWTEEKFGGDPDDAFRSHQDNFLKDIRNAKIFYSYELTRRHILLSDNIYKTAATISLRQGRNPRAFDLLIIAMGLDLMKIHGRERFYIVTTDPPLADVCGKQGNDLPQVLNIAVRDIPSRIF